jgi:CHAD domain-containing protein
MLDAETQQKHQPQTSSSPDSPALTAADPMIVFAYACLRREFRALLDHRPRGDDVPGPAEIHRTRIAARRLRVALKMFKDLLPPGAAASLGAELSWFARALGDVRDLDVYTDNLRRYTAAMPDAHPELVQYERHVHTERDAARAALPTLFTDPRYVALLQSFNKLLESSPKPGALRRWRSFSVGEGAHAHLRKRLKRFIKRGNQIVAAASTRDLHRLRIMAKRLRYELEFFADVYPSLAHAAKVTRQLQDVLGEHQDCRTASARVRGYVRDRGGRAGALGDLQRSHDRHAAAAQRRFELEWRNFKKNVALDELQELLAA